MGSVGDAYDNAMCESFFATLECELLDREHFRTPAEARRKLFEFIEGWYNPRRRHSALRGGPAFSDKESGCVKWMNCSSVTAIMPTQRSSDHETLS